MDVFKQAKYIVWHEGAQNIVGEYMVEILNTKLRNLNVWLM